MSKYDPIAVVPTPDEVRAELQRIVVSDVFSASPQLAAFLSFVVEAVLHGNSDRIKGYTIGVEALRRDPKFDPQLDPIVRVEATRLRRAMERYYAGPGLTDAVMIDLPRGSYVPTFNHRMGLLIDPDQLPVNETRFPRWLLISGTFALVACLIAGTVLFAIRREQAELPGFKQASEELRALSPGNGMPILIIQDFETRGVTDSRSFSAHALSGKIINVFSRFDGINVVAATDQPRGNIDYRLGGLIEYLGDGIANVRFDLTDATDGIIFWSKSFEHMAVSGDRAGVENSISSGIAVTLLQPFGVIKSRDRAKFLAGGKGDPRYQCLLLAADSFRSFDPDESTRARSCLEALTEIDRGFSDGFSYLASLNNREFVYGFGKGADDPRTLDIALQLARRGVERNPNSARAWQVLSTVLFSRHDTVAAFAAVERALMLNPNDLIIVGEYGGRLITTGEIERGMNVLQNATSLGGVRPSWHHFYFFLYHYMRGRLPEATHEANAMTTDTYTHGLFARALIAAVNGDMDKARSTWAKLVALRSAWRDNPRGELEKYIFAPEILDRLLRDLAASGLAAAK
jgi:TolB-like protein